MSLFIKLIYITLIKKVTYFLFFCYLTGRFLNFALSFYSVKSAIRGIAWLILFQFSSLYFLLKISMLNVIHPRLFISLKAPLYRIASSTINLLSAILMFQYLISHQS